MVAASRSPRRCNLLYTLDIPDQKLKDSRFLNDESSGRFSDIMSLKRLRKTRCPITVVYISVRSAAWWTECDASGSLYLNTEHVCVDRYHSSSSRRRSPIEFQIKNTDLKNVAFTSWTMFLVPPHHKIRYLRSKMVKNTSLTYQRALLWPVLLEDFWFYPHLLVVVLCSQTDLTTKDIIMNKKHIQV